MADRLIDAFGSLADDLAEQALHAHVEGHPEKSDVLYAVAGSIRRAMIDVLDDRPDDVKPGFVARIFG